MLDKTDEMGKRKGNVGDLLCGSLNENLKRLKRVKEQNFKRQAEIFQLMISEVLESVKELTNVRKNFLGARGIYLKFKVWYVDFKFFLQVGQEALSREMENVRRIETEVSGCG